MATRTEFHYICGWGTCGMEDIERIESKWTRVWVKNNKRGGPGKVQGVDRRNPGPCVHVLVNGLFDPVGGRDP